VLAGHRAGAQPLREHAALDRAQKRIVRPEDHKKNESLDASAKAGAGKTASAGKGMPGLANSR